MNKGLEALERLCKYAMPLRTNLTYEDIELVKKELKVLEFVKRVLHIEPREYHLSDGTSEYVLKYDIYNRTITKEEFDLLKELGDF